MDTSLVALVPARSGSRRIPGKNVRMLAGHPLLAYTITAARASGVFDRVLVSTDDEQIAAMARHYGAVVPFLRPVEFAGERSADIEWLGHLLAELRTAGDRPEAFSILRPTSPLRQAHTIARAAREFLGDDCDSLRAVEPCRQHPAKMWVVDGARMHPLLDDHGADPPWHSTPYQALPSVYVQNASLEIAWTRVVEETGTIAGRAIRPFVTDAYEGFDLNEPEDWWVLERLLADGRVALPPVEEEAYAP